MLAKDIAFSSSQHVYRRFSKLTVQGESVTVDLTEALSKPTDCLSGEFYISFKNDLTPTSCTGGTLELYETHESFKTYKIRHTDNLVRISVK